MCTISYGSIGPIISDDDLIQNITRKHGSKPLIEPDTDSKSSSFDLSWLGPLPESNLTHLPKFNDFEYIGRVGDGAFAQVYCVEHIPSKQYVAIKVADGKNEQARQQLEVERQILFRYSHGSPYMTKAYCTFHQGVRRRDLKIENFSFHFRVNYFLLWNLSKVELYIIKFKQHG
jgi:hypothetical protein